MIATLPFVQKKFEEFNGTMFAGKLPKLSIELCHARTFLGQCVYMRKRNLFGKTVNSNFRLKISTKFDLPENELEDTIIHEMIHYYIAVNNLKDTSTHGRLFRQIMEDINETFSRHLTISHKSTSEQKEKNKDMTPRWHVVAVVRFHDGRSGIKVVPRIWERIRSYRDNISRWSEVKSIEFFLTNNPFFNNYPNSVALRVYPLSEEQISINLKGSKIIEL